MKKLAWKKCRKIFLEATFSHSRKLFKKYMVSLAWKISHCLSANHNLELRCVISTGVTLFVSVLHLNCTGLSQSELSIFYVSNYVMKLLKTTASNPNKNNHRVNLHAL